MSTKRNSEAGEAMNNPSYADAQYYHLWWLLVSLRRAGYKARAKELFKYGITPEEAAVLFVIKTHGYRTTPAEISRWLLRESHTVSSLLIRMEKKGLVKKVKDLERKNMVRVAITEKGQQVYDQADKRESVKKIMSVLSEEEYLQFKAYLVKLRNKAFEELRLERTPPFPPMQ